MKNRTIKSLENLLLSSELLVEPGISKTYWRLLLILYLLSFIVLIDSSIHLGIKLIVAVFILKQAKTQYAVQKPHASLHAIQYRQKQWVLIMKDNHEFVYDNALILVHNMLFQLIQFSDSNKKQLVILFNDQVVDQKLRLLHIKTMNY